MCWNIEKIGRSRRYFWETKLQKSCCTWSGVLCISTRIPEAESKEKHGIWDPVPKLSITSPYVHFRVDSNTFTMGNLIASEAIHTRSIPWGCPWSVPGGQGGITAIFRLQVSGSFQYLLTKWGQENLFSFREWKDGMLAAVKDNNMYCTVAVWRRQQLGKDHRREKTATAAQRQLWKEDNSCEKNYNRC